MQDDAPVPSRAGLWTTRGDTFGSFDPRCCVTSSAKGAPQDFPGEEVRQALHELDRCGALEPRDASSRRPR